MMLIQLLLVSGILIALVWFLSNSNSNRIKAWKKILGVLFTVVAVATVLIPETTSDVAHVVGVGRGADLLLYMLTLAFIFVCINMYSKSQEEQKRIAQLARKIAILEANQRNKK